MTPELAEIARRVHQPDDRVVTELATIEGDLVVLGAGGKMGVSLCRMAAEAFDKLRADSAPAARTKLAGDRRVFAVSRFSDAAARTELENAGVTTVATDLMNEDALADLPEAPNVVYLVGRKFGTTGDEAATWAINAYLPGRVVRRYPGARIVAFSSGNVYPLVPVVAGGADERVPPAPVGEYAQSCLGRERVLTYHAAATGTRLALIRLNYAIDCRYGVLTDIARSVRDGRPVDLETGAVNVVWQGDANRYALCALAHADRPPLVLNVTGPEVASVRWLATQLGRRLGRDPVFRGTEAPTALLSNAAACFGRFGYPSVSLDQMLDWTAAWLRLGGPLLDKPTQFGQRQGRF